MTMTTEKKHGQNLHMEGKYKIKDAVDLQIDTLNEDPTWLGATKKSVLEHIRKLVIKSRSLITGTDSIGAMGAIGKTGGTGLTGATGPTRSTVRGLVGATGQTGIAPSGPTGVGITGATGGIGETGATGVSGAVGYALVTGIRGMTGVTSVTGITGSTGAPGIFLVVDNKVTSPEENVNGLASCITLANAIKVKLNLHYADYGLTGQEHTTADGEVTTNDATNLSTLKTLLNALTSSYSNHDDDAELPVSWEYHQAQETGNASLIAVTAVTTLVECIVRANDLKAKLNTHMADTTAHTNGDSAVVAASNAGNLNVISVSATGVTGTDRIFWSVLDGSAGQIYGIAAAVGMDCIEFNFNGDPGSDTILSYVVFRP
jgi:hypothetical protein